MAIKHHKTALHFTVLYVLFLVLIISMFVFTDTSTEEWVCVEKQCTSFGPGGETWAANNCIPVELNSTLVDVCRVVIGEDEQYIRKDLINLSSISQCVQVSCLQEARVRSVNYTIEQ